MAQIKAETLGTALAQLFKLHTDQNVLVLTALLSDLSHNLKIGKLFKGELVEPPFEHFHPLVDHANRNETLSPDVFAPLENFAWVEAELFEQHLDP